MKEDFLYIKGDYKTDGSFRHNFNNGKTEKRVSGVWIQLSINAII